MGKIKLFSKKTSVKITAGICCVALVGALGIVTVPSVKNLDGITNMNHMFEATDFNANINWTGLTSIQSTLTVENMFLDTMWNNKTIKVANSTIRTKFITGTGATEANIVL